MYDHTCRDGVPRLHRPYRPAHNDFSTCQIRYYLGSQTVGEVVSSLIANYADPLGSVDRDAIARMVDDYFAVNPNGTIIAGNYTPRGRKRRGLHTKRRRLFCVKLGAERRYLPEVAAYYGRADITATVDRVTVPCRCRGVNRAHMPLKTVLWPEAS